LGVEIAAAYLHPRNRIYGGNSVYLTEAKDRFQHYIRRLNSNVENAVKFEQKGNWLQKKQLINAWRMSVESIERRNPAAIKLLSVFAMLDTDKISLRVLESIFNFEPSFHPSEQGELGNQESFMPFSEANFLQGHRY
jgi:hypothetical protein